MPKKKLVPVFLLFDVYHVLCVFIHFEVDKTEASSWRRPRAAAAEPRRRFMNSTAKKKEEPTVTQLCGTQKHHIRLKKG